MKVAFDELEGSDLTIDCIYAGGTKGDFSDDPLTKLFPKCGNQSGFRRVSRKDKNAKDETGKSKLAYVVLTTSMSELEWPDYLNEETGVFRYYGDNRQAGRRHTSTKQEGNKILEHVFNLLNSGESLEDMPPFFIFKRTGQGRDFKFLGLAAPGTRDKSPDNELIAVWKTLNENRFLNYEAYFTILDTGETAITQEWLHSLIHDHKNNLRYAPAAWKNFISKGREGIKPLTASRIRKIPTNLEQLNCDRDGKKCLNIIHDHYKSHAHDFEALAVDLICKMDENFINFKLTRKSRDGGYDAYGQYLISSESKVNYPLKMNCFLEAKCYSPDHGVGVKDMSRLISRIKHREFGIFVTTSYINKTAYKEVVEDQHPILFITGSDIVRILKTNSINSTNLIRYLESIDENIYRLS